MKSNSATIWSKNYICALLANAFLAMSHNAVNTLVSSYATFLGAGAKMMGLLTGLFFGVALAMRPFAGPITTRVDKRKLMIFVYMLGSLVNVGYACFHSITAFVIFRFFNGVQYALVGSLCTTIAGDSLPAEKMASGLGVFGVGGAVATSIAPSIGIWLRSYGEQVKSLDFGYTLVFLFGALCLAASLIPCFLLNPDKKTAEDLQAAGKWYTNIASRHAVGPAVVMMFLVIAYSQYSSYMVPFGESVGIENVGVFFTVLACVLLASRPLSGTLTDRLGLGKVLLPSIVIFSISFFVVSASTKLGMTLVGAVIAAIGYGAANPATQSMCMQCETPVRRAVASNTLYIGIDLGYFLGPLIGGFIKEYAEYKQVIRFGFIPTLVAGIVLCFSLKPYYRRLEELKAK